MNYDKSVFCPLVFNLYKYLYYSKLNDVIHTIYINPGDMLWLRRGLSKVKGVLIKKTSDGLTTDGLNIIIDVFDQDVVYYGVNADYLKFWLPTDFILKKKLLMKELPIYVKTLHMKKITNLVIKCITKRDIEWQIKNT